MKNSDWGDFGSFFGGVYGSIFSSIALVVAIRSAVKTNKSNSIQLLLIRNEQHFNQFTKLLEHLKENYVTSHKYGQSTESIERIYQLYQIWIGIGFTGTYNPNIPLEVNLINAAIDKQRSDAHRYILQNEAKLFVCMIQLIENSPPDLSDAMKVIFENSFDNSQRFSLEMYTRAHYPSANGFLNKWTTLSELPEGILDTAKQQLKNNKLL
jgi:hypothetical protein